MFFTSWLTSLAHLYSLSARALRRHPRQRRKSITIASAAEIYEARLVLTAAPFFSPNSYTFSVDETAANPTDVGTVSATDADNDIMGYSITAGDPNSVFTMDSGGSLKVNGMLDYETTTQYTLTVQVQDMEGNSDTASVTVNINDVDEAPVFSPTTYTFSVGENAATGTTVGTLSATDPQNDIMGYSITVGDANSVFTIDSSGTLKVNGTLDSETTSSYTLTVQVQDMGGHTDTATVTVNVTDVAEDPAFSPATYTFSVAEDAAHDTTIGTLSATDPQNDITSYSITAGDPNSVFTMDSSGNLKVNGTLDYEATNTYTLTVQVQDMSGHTDTATVTVNVTNVAENPVFSPTTYTFSVAEDAANDTTVGTLSATDPQNDITSYSITAGDPNFVFTMDSSGNLKVNGTLDYETTNSYTLTVQVQDMGGHTDTATVTVNITGVDQDPAFSASTYTFSAAEDATANTTVGTLSATDPQNDITSYSITAGDPNSVFTMDSSGNLKLNGAFDYESTTSYTLTVQVQDMAGHTDTATVTVNVTDVAEAPSFSAATYTFNIAETASVGSVIGTTTATDPQNDIAGFTITGGDSSCQFTTDSTGQIKINGMLNFEMQSTYTLTIEVSDYGGEAPDTATVTINVTDVNEPPVITSTTLTSFTDDLNAVVGDTEAQDEDIGDTLTYSITSGNSLGAFSIDSSTGEIRLNEADLLWDDAAIPDCPDAAIESLGGPDEQVHIQLGIRVTDGAGLHADAVIDQFVSPDSINGSFWAAIAKGQLAKAVEIIKVARETGVALLPKGRFFGPGLAPMTGLLNKIFERLPAAAMQCTRSARLVFDAFKNAGNTPAYVKITNSANAQQWYTNYPDPATRFTNDGTHYVVKLNGRIYDALTGASGMLESAYVSMMNGYFGGVGTAVLTEIPNLP